MRRAVIVGMAVSVCVLAMAAGCSNSGKAGGDAAAGITDTSDPILDMSSESVEKYPGAAVDAAVKAYEKMPPSVGMKIVDRTEKRLVVDLDWAAMNSAMRGGTRGAKGGDQTPVPVRFVFDFEPRGEKMGVRQRMYYIGDDPKMADHLRDGYKGTRLERTNRGAK